MRRVKIKNSAGFTIIELMIALAVLSTLLVASTIILLQLGKLYTKGVNQANTQNATRNIVNDIASQLQLSGDTPDLSHASNGVFCIGNQRYTFLLNRKVVSSSTPLSGSDSYHALWRDTTSASGTCNALNMSQPIPSDVQTKPGSGVELLPVNMRLTDFSITSNANDTYTIYVTVAYGDDDLVQYTPSPSDTTHCDGAAGTEYCAVSSLRVIVGRRIVAN